MKKTVWGSCRFGEAHLYELTAGEFSAKVSDFGATLVDWTRGGMSLVLGSDELSFYEGKCGSMGATIGRFANRINYGKFTLDGVEHQLNCNEGSHHLHGGPCGFEKRLWTVTAADDNSITLRYTSPDGEENYPGTLTVEVKYTLSADGSLAIEYAANTDKPTILNLTNHTYFNLGCDDILGCRMTIPADRWVETGAGSIPTGLLAEVEGTVMDLRGGVVLGEKMGDEYLVPTGGYDHCYVLGDAPTADLHLAAKVEAPNGIVLECRTDQPSVQLYCGCQLTPDIVTRHGTAKRYQALCLETQVFPDSPNHAHFTNCVLRPGETFTSKTVYTVK